MRALSLSPSILWSMMRWILPSQKWQAPKWDHNLSLQQIVLLFVVLNKKSADFTGCFMSIA